MNRRTTRARHRGRAAVQTAALTALLALPVLAAAGPAWAESNDQLGPTEGQDPGAGLPAGVAVLLFVAVPIVSILLIAAVVWLPNVSRSTRYRPQRGWAAPPVWFAGPPDPAAAVETADAQGATVGGASGSW